MNFNQASIGVLTCRVKLSTSARESSPVSQGNRPGEAFRFEAPPQAPRGAAETSASTPEISASGKTAKPSPPGRVNPEKVAGRVYDLMREEARNARFRGSN